MPDDAPAAATPPLHQKAGSVKDIVTKKVGPLPLWGWALVAGVGLFLWKRRQAAKGVATTGTAGASINPSLSSLGYSTGGNTGSSDGGSTDSFIMGLQNQLNQLQGSLSPTVSNGSFATGPGGIAPVQGFNPVAVLNSFSSNGGPISYDQAVHAVITAYNTFLHRQPESPDIVNAYAQEIVGDQSYGKVLGHIAYSPEAESFYKGTNLAPPAATQS